MFLWVGIQEWLSWWFWLRVSHEAVVKTPARPLASEGLARAGGPAPEQAHHVAAGRRLPLPTMWTCLLLSS